MKVRVVAAAVVLAAGVSGCSGKSDPIQTPETVGVPGTALPVPGEGATEGPVPTAGATTSAATSASTGADPYPDIDPKDEASAVAFVKAYINSLNIAVRDPRRSSIRQMRLEGCKGCVGLEQNIERMRTEGQHFQADLARLVKVRSDFAPGRTVVVALIDEQPGMIVDGNGRAVTTVKGSNGTKVSYFLARQNDSWKIQEMKAYEGVV